MDRAEVAAEGKAAKEGEEAEVVVAAASVAGVAADVSGLPAVVIE